MRRILALLLILMTFALSAESLVAHEAHHDHDESITHLQASNTVDDAHSGANASHVPGQHPCHLGHCPFVVFAQPRIAAAQSMIAAATFPPANARYASPPSRGLFRPPARVSA